MPRRWSTVTGAGLLLVAVLGVLTAAAPAGAAAFTDAAGRRVLLPPQIGRILPAERNAEVLVFVLAPDRLAGLEAMPGRRALPRRGIRAPMLGWRPRSTPAEMAATARQVGADLIVDAGPVSPAAAVFADQVEALSGVPYILVDDSFARMPTILRAIGAILGSAGRADELGLYAEHAIAGLRGRLLIRPATMRPRVYYGLGPDGLSTVLPGSPAGAAIDEAGAINVAAPLGRGGRAPVSRGQLLAWDPDFIIAERRSFYDQLLRAPGWRRLAAVRNKRVYLEPSEPFGWIEDPSGVNRLIGLYWLSSLFYPDATQEDLRSTACDFYDKFYRIRLTNAQLEALVRPAGAPPAEAPRNVAEPLVGLGAAPPSTLPGGPAAPSPAPPGALPQVPPPAMALNETCTLPGTTTPISGPPLAAPGVTREPAGPGAAPGISPSLPSITMPPGAGVTPLPEIAPGQRGARPPGRRGPGEGAPPPSGAR